MIAIRSILIAGIVACFGCTGSVTDHGKPQAGKTTPTPKATETDEVAVERAKLSPEDKALVDAQEWCVVADDSRLGSMGAPLKLMVKDTPVFVCCKSCEKRALSDPDKTLARLAELKDKAKAGKK
ncbi:MAG: hypothetical protein U0746_14790 [Gemmataceae bacterium]